MKLQKKLKEKVLFEERIARRAYELYKNRGCHHGYALEDWIKAKNEILLDDWLQVKKDILAVKSQGQAP